MKIFRQSRCCLRVDVSSDPFHVSSPFRRHSNVHDAFGDASMKIPPYAGDLSGFVFVHDPRMNHASDVGACRRLVA